MTDTLADIAALAAQFAGREISEIAPGTRLYADLGLTGDDAHGLMAVFAERFSVDMGGFVWLRYFDDEGWNMLDPAVVMAASLVSRGFMAQWAAATSAEREITISHLADVAARRAWFEPGAEHHRPRRTAFANVLSLAAAVATAFLVLVGALACYGYLTGALGDAHRLAAIGLFAMTLLPLVLVWASIRNVRRKLASA